MKKYALILLTLVSSTVSYAGPITLLSWTPSTKMSDGTPILNHQGYQVWCKNTANYSTVNSMNIPSPSIVSLTFIDLYAGIPLDGFVTCTLKTGALINGSKVWSVNSNEVTFYMDKGTATSIDPLAKPLPVALTIK